MKRATAVIVVEVLLAALIAAAAWYWLVWRPGNYINKPWEDFSNRTHLIRHIRSVADNDPSVRALIDARIADGWTVNQAVAETFAWDNAPDRWKKYCRFTGFLRPDPRHRLEFRDPWGKPYDLRIMDGYLVLMDPPPGSEAADFAARQAAADPREKRGGRWGNAWQWLQSPIQENRDKTDPLGRYLYSRFSAGQWAAQQMGDSTDSSVPLPIAAVIRCGDAHADLELYFLDEDFAVTSLVVRGEGGWEGVFHGFHWPEGYRWHFDDIPVRWLSLNVSIADRPPAESQPATTQAHKSVPDVWLPPQVLKGKLQFGLIAQDGTRSEMIDAFVVRAPTPATSPH